jgi:hypothetical protein
MCPHAREELFLEIKLVVVDQAQGATRHCFCSNDIRSLGSLVVVCSSDRGLVASSLFFVNRNTSVSISATSAFLRSTSFDWDPR